MFTITIEYPDGTMAIWTIEDFQPIIEKLEEILGTPETMKC